MPEKLLTITEVSNLLGISEEEVKKLVKQGELPAYRIGGEYLRFRKEQIAAIKNEIPAKITPSEIRPVPLRKQKVSRSQSEIVTRSYSQSFADSLLDLFYFNDFYVVAAIIICVILWFIFR